jgi:TrkA domain protein
MCTGMIDSGFFKKTSLVFDQRHCLGVAPDAQGNAAYFRLPPLHDSWPGRGSGTVLRPRICGVNIVETMLPGVGMRYDLTTGTGGNFCLVIDRDGAAEIFTVDEDDPDQAVSRLQLDPDEAMQLAELLGAPRITQRFADLSREIPGLETERVTVGKDSPYAGGALGDTRARTRTGCSVVAIIRGEAVITGPTPQERLLAGDVLIAVGGAEGLSALEALLNPRPGR